MKKGFLFFLLFAAGIQTALAQGGIDSVISRYDRYLETTVRYEPGAIRHWMQTLDARGRWPDIDYGDRQRANWALLHPLERIELLSLAWTDPGGAFFQNREVGQAINRALDDWLTNRYQNPNWWHNQIGVPQYMRNILMLLHGRLSPERRKEALEVLEQLRVQGPGAGANLIWSADLGLCDGALTGDTVRMDSCRMLILQEIRISTGEGVQPDYSFHQHGSRLQMYQYGKAYLWSTLQLAWELEGTRWAFPKDKVSLLTDLLLKGWQWMARGINTVPGTMDRSASRKNELRSPDIRPLLPFLRDLEPAKTKIFEAIWDRQDGRGYLSGFRYFPYSDFSAYQGRDFSFFLKTISTRTLPSEVGLNSENLKGFLLNAGDGYLVKNGDEYFNLMPFWDWSKLPGITAFPGARIIQRMPFAGSVSDGNSGLTAMTETLEDTSKTKRLSAHKFWACHENMVVCLISGIRTKNITGDLYTALDQCRLQGAVTVNRPGNRLQPGMHPLRQVRWIQHAGFAYIPIKPSRMNISLGPAQGKWSDINQSESDTLLTDRVFMPVLVQDAGPGITSTGYVLAACASPRKARALARKHPWIILRNDADCQAVRWKDGMLMAAFFSASVLTLSGKTMQPDRPCLLLERSGKLYASDPLHRGGLLHVTLGDSVRSAVLPADGRTVMMGSEENIIIHH